LHLDLGEGVLIAIFQTDQAVVNANAIEKKYGDDDQDYYR
jgi:hypothetical protein